METLDPARLEALLNLLVQNGVQEFEGWGFHVRFADTCFTEDKVAPAPSQVMTIEERHEPQSNWEDTSLWPGGKIPRFPTK